MRCTFCLCHCAAGWQAWGTPRRGRGCGLAGYGINGGARAVEHLRLVLSDLKVTCVRSVVGLTFAGDFEDFTRFTPSDPQDKNVTAMLDELVAKGTTVRQPDRPQQSPAKHTS